MLWALKHFFILHTFSMEFTIFFIFAKFAEKTAKFTEKVQTYKKGKDKLKKKMCEIKSEKFI